MSTTVTVEGRRVYIQARYGDPCIPQLKLLGAHWDPGTKRWWIGSGKKAQVEACIASSAGKPNAVDEAREVTVSGKAAYKGRNYYVRWIGECKGGEYKARLCTLDGKLDFWVPAARPFSGDAAAADVARVTKAYKDDRPLAEIRQFVERLREEEASGVDRGEAPDEDCYWSGSEWLVKGCPACKAAGTMCRRCAFDVYDN